MTLIPNWKDALKWFSTQAMAIAAAGQITWANLPPDMRNSVPEGWVMYGTVVVLILGIFGRVVKQGPAA